MSPKEIRDYKRNIITGLVSGLATGIAFYIGESFGTLSGKGLLVGLPLSFIIIIGIIVRIAKMKIR